MGLLTAVNRLPWWRRRVRVHGALLEASSLDRLIYLSLQRRGWMGAEERAFFEKNIEPGMRVVEAGANLGVFTVLLSQLVGLNGKVFAFEPDAALHAALLTNLERNAARNAVPFQCAVGARADRLALKCGGLNSGDNRLCHAAAEPDATSVEVVTMDDALAGERIDFVKLDVQGWELEALRGMSRIIAENPNLQLFIECWPYGLRRAGGSPTDLVNFLQENRFRLTTVHGVPFSAADVIGWDERPRKFTNLYAIRA